MNCIRCGKEIDSTTTVNQTCYECLNIGESVDLSRQLGIHAGWFCPKCGSVLSPNKDYCPFCLPAWKTTTGFNPSSNWCGEQAIGVSSAGGRAKGAPFDEFGLTFDE